MVTVWWSAAHLIHYRFLNPSETITSEKCAQQIVEMCRKLQLLQPALVKRLGPVLPHGSAQPTFQNLNELGTKFCLIHRIHLPSPIDYHVFKHLDHFLEAKCLHNQQEAEHGFQESV